MFFWLVLAFLAIPLGMSFHRRVLFYKDFLLVLPAIFISTAVFMVWDYFFTVWGVWHWEPKGGMGVFLLGMPIETMLLYLSLSFSGIFVYFCTKKLIKKDMLEQVHKFISALFLLFTLTIFFAFSRKLYTSMAALVCSFMLICRMWIALPRSMGYFYKSFLFILAPVILLYIILTAYPVISYDAAYISGITLLKMPLENIMYFLALHLMNIGIYSYLKRKTEAVPITEIEEKEVIQTV